MAFVVLKQDDSLQGIPPSFGSTAFVFYFVGFGCDGVFGFVQAFIYGGTGFLRSFLNGFTGYFRFAFGTLPGFRSGIADTLTSLFHIFFQAGFALSLFLLTHFFVSRCAILGVRARCQQYAKGNSTQCLDVHGVSLQ